ICASSSGSRSAASSPIMAAVGKSLRSREEISRSAASSASVTTSNAEVFSRVLLSTAPVKRGMISVRATSARISPTVTASLRVKIFILILLRTGLGLSRLQHRIAKQVVALGLERLGRRLYVTGFFVLAQLELAL